MQKQQKAVKFRVQIDKVCKAMSTHWQEQPGQEETNRKVKKDIEDQNSRHAATYINYVELTH